jgi:hypothetical protein
MFQLREGNACLGVGKVHLNISLFLRLMIQLHSDHDKCSSLSWVKMYFKNHFTNVLYTLFGNQIMRPSYFMKFNWFQITKHDVEMNNQ